MASDREVTGYTALLSVGFCFSTECVPHMGTLEISPTPASQLGPTPVCEMSPAAPPALPVATQWHVTTQWHIAMLHVTWQGCLSGVRARYLCSSHISQSHWKHCPLEVFLQGLAGGLRHSNTSCQSGWTSGAFRFYGLTMTPPSLQDTNLLQRWTLLHLACPWCL